MVSDTLGQQLHDRATHGEQLSETELMQLTEWYANHDEVETAELGLQAIIGPTVELQTQINAALAQLSAITKRLQEISAENDLLRQEIASLRLHAPQLA